MKEHTYLDGRLHTSRPLNAVDLAEYYHDGDMVDYWGGLTPYLLRQKLRDENIWIGDQARDEIDRLARDYHFRIKTDRNAGKGYADLVEQEVGEGGWEKSLEAFEYYKQGIELGICGFLGSEWFFERMAVEHTKYCFQHAPLLIKFKCLGDLVDAKAASMFK